MVQKIAVSLNRKTVTDLDRWVREGRYPNRSRALQSAVDMLSEREKRSRLARELAKLNRSEEKRMAGEGLRLYRVVLAELEALGLYTMLPWATGSLLNLPTHPRCYLLYLYSIRSAPKETHHETCYICRRYSYST